MNRREDYFESMLRNLGSVYYQTLQGQASAADVASAVESVRASETATADQATPAAQVPPQVRGGPTSTTGTRPGTSAGRGGKWRVSDVMTREVVTADRNMPYKQVVQLLADHGLSAVPVVSGGDRVLGVISEADVLRKEERAFGRIGTGLPHRTRQEREQAEALTADRLMTSPAVTVHPDAPLGAAVRLLNGHRIKQLPVVNPAGELLGIVSRHDLLNVFLRPDQEIAEEVAYVIGSMLLTDPERIAVNIADGVVTLTGELPRAELIGVATRLAGDVEGVVAVTNRLTSEHALPRHG